jgi:O-antigen ligase
MSLFALLIYALAVLWVDDRWAWRLFQAGVFALGAVAAAGWARGADGPPRRVALAALAGAAAWPLLQLAAGASMGRWQTTEAALDWATWLVVFALALQLFADPARQRQRLEAISIFGLVFSAVAVTQNLTSGGKVFWLFPSGFPDGVMGPFVNRNQYAAFIELLLPVSLYSMLREERRAWLHGAAAAAMAASVVAGASRAGTVLMLADVMVVLGLGVGRRMASRRRLAAGAAIFAGLAFSFTAAVGWEHLLERFEHPYPQDLRLEALRASGEMVRARPWLGTGLGTWATAYPGYAAFDPGVRLNQAHNDWAQWAAEGGLPFVGLLLMFAASLGRRAVRSIWGIGVLALLLHGLVDYPLQQRPGLAAWFFAAAGAVAARPAARRRET